MELLLIKSKVQEQPQRAAVPCKALYLCLPLSLSCPLTNVRRPKMLTVSNYQSRNRNRKTQQAREEEAEEEDEAEKKEAKKCAEIVAQGSD